MSYSTQTARRLITRVLRGINYIPRNGDPNGPDSQDAFDTLVEMMASWNLEPMLPGYIVGQPLTLIANQQTYVVGPSGAINQGRPEKIEQASFVTSTAPNYIEKPLRVIRTIREWQLVPDKFSTATEPSAVYLDPRFTTATTALLYVYRVPSTGGTMIVYLQGRYIALDDLDTEIILPDGVARALRYNLGVELAPEFGKELPLMWEQRAIESKAKLKSIRIQPGLLELDGVMGVGQGSYNVNSDTYH